MNEIQPKLFSVEPEPWELDDAEQQRIATVVFVEGLAGEFDYSVPDALSERLRAGCRVEAPLGRGNRKVTGYCVAVCSRASTRRLKPISRVIDDASLVGPQLLALTKWMSEYYLCPWGQALEAALPAGVRGNAGTRQVTFVELPTRVAARMTTLKLTAKQEDVMRVLLSAGRPMSQQELIAAANCSTAPVKSLLKRGLLETRTRVVHSAAPGDGSTDAVRDEPPTLNPDQHRALTQVLEAVERRDSQPIVLHGVTGSGKTEVYLRAIAEVLSYGQQAIVLVPEISLTPQTQRRFRARLGNVAVLHSHLSGVERHGYWRRIASGQAPVIVGARSAVFAPTPNLGLIILDEEHDASFKQDIAPRYHARDVAIQRAQREGAALLLGSATPALETLHATLDKRATLVRMPRRVAGRPMPHVQAIDMRIDARTRGRGALSRQLADSMRSAVGQGGQVILLLNRRGFSTNIQCPACGHVVQCPHCELSLTHHREGEKTICHYCDYQSVAPQRCSECGFEGLRYSGLGTQRLEAEVRSRFPDSVCLRMDSDSMQKHGSHEAALADFREGRAQILLGTQMIAKGLDFPNVTLVGVVNADSALHFADFRAAERTFQLVTQVAGRTGRGDKGGHVLVQTFQPEHPAIQAALHHDYLKFCEYELPQRQAFGYPPYGAIIRMVVRSESEPAAQVFADAAAGLIERQLEKQGGVARRLGPAPAPLPKLRGKYRLHALWVSQDRESLRSAMQQAAAQFKTPDAVQWIYDVDPQDML